MAMEWTLVDTLTGADWLEGACTLLVPHGDTTEALLQRCRDQLGEIHVMATPDRFWVLVTFLPDAHGSCVQAMGSVCVPWGGDLQLSDEADAPTVNDIMDRWSGRRRHCEGFCDKWVERSSDRKFALLVVALLCVTQRDWGIARPGRDPPHQDHITSPRRQSPRDRRSRERPHSRRRFSERRESKHSRRRFSERRERKHSGFH